MNFDEKVVDRIKRLEREVERLQVKESPIMSNYLLTTGKAADSDKLDGLDSTAFVQASALGAWLAYTPTFGGFSTDPSGTCRYCIIGKLCHVVIHLTSSGTSNANTFTMSMPVTGSQATYASIPRYMNNNTWEYGGFASIGATTVHLGTNTTGLEGWTTSGSKTAYLQFFYEVA